MNGTLDMSDTCFVDNKVIHATVASVSDAPPLLMDNNGRSIEDTELCAFAAVSTTHKTNEFDCIDFVLTSCFQTFTYDAQSNAIVPSSMSAKAPVFKIQTSGTTVATPLIIAIATTVSCLSGRRLFCNIFVKE
jgi:hypothetical protein